MGVRDCCDAFRRDAAQQIIVRESGIAGPFMTDPGVGPVLGLSYKARLGISGQYAGPDFLRPGVRSIEFALTDWHGVPQTADIAHC